MDGIGERRGEGDLRIAPDEPGDIDETEEGDDDWGARNVEDEDDDEEDEDEAGDNGLL